MNKKENRQNIFAETLDAFIDNPFVKIDERRALAGAYAVFRFCKTKHSLCGSKCPIRSLINCDMERACLVPREWGYIYFDDNGRRENEYNE